MKITDTDLGYKRIQREFRKGDKDLDVGILEKEGQRLKEGSTSGVTLAEVATTHEFGAPTANIPQRSFLRSTVDEHRGYVEELEDTVTRMIAGVGSIDSNMRRLGKRVVNDVVTKIQRGIDPALKDATIAKKGISSPLIETGQLINSIDFEVK